jgi:hypothetical protein
VSGLTFSADVVYRNVDADFDVVYTPAGGIATRTGDTENWAGRLRIQRDF